MKYNHELPCISDAIGISPERRLEIDNFVIKQVYSKDKISISQMIENVVEEFKSSDKEVVWGIYMLGSKIASIETVISLIR